MKRMLTILAAAGGLGLAGASAPSGCDPTSAARDASASRAGSGGSSGSGSGSALRAKARLRGFQEVPAISTPGRGSFEAELSADGTTLSWTLSYADLKGNTVEGGAVTGAHLHLAQRGVNGGIAIHFCGGGGGTGACPAPPATLTGMATADNVVGPAGQGLDPGKLGDLVEAIRAGVTYVNVHTTRFPGGEIRGQVRAHHGHGHDEDDDGHD